MQTSSKYVLQNVRFPEATKNFGSFSKSMKFNERDNFIFSEIIKSLLMRFSSYSSLRTILSND